jgi:putative NADPH-quinone reductase
MKTLIVVAHPEIANSNVNKKWVEELGKHPDKFTIRQLYKVYPDEKIDVPREQELIEAHDKLILQFPMYWFNCPPLLKKWLDAVFTYGWAYGSKGDMLKDKKVALGISAGISEEDFAAYNTPCINFFDQLTSPFKATFTYTKSDYRSYFAFFDANEPTDEKLELKAKEYVNFIFSL